MYYSIIKTDNIFFNLHYKFIIILLEIVNNFLGSQLLFIEILFFFFAIFHVPIIWMPPRGECIKRSNSLKRELLGVKGTSAAHNQKSITLFCIKTDRPRNLLRSRVSGSFMSRLEKVFCVSSSRNDSVS
jgi:hypothetical protein